MKFSGYTLLTLFFAAGAGAAMAIQGAINSKLGKTIGLIESAIVVQAIGLIAGLAAFGIFWIYQGNSKFAALGQAPWYSFLGGFLGVLILLGVVASIPPLGVGNATTSIVAAQLLTAFIIDCFGLFGAKPVPIHWTKIFGLLLIAAGARLILCK
ncbi:MAG: DMT family transporter [Bacillota bacterium]